MKKLILAMIASMALVGCSKQEGGAFEGVWNKAGERSETLTVTKAGEGYRVTSEFSDPDWSGFNIEAKVVAESKTLLVKADGKRALELQSDGTVKSYLRKKEETFSKTN